MHFYDALADAFIAEDVNQVFGLLGDGNMHWSSAMSDKGVDFFYSRHEHCAVSMAMGYARAKDKIGVATVTCGPGLTQTMTALTT
ncbi:MAG: thiamine pyrophosphate-binding protein, partial [Pelagibacteraceae bacterium]